MPGPTKPCPTNRCRLRSTKRHYPNLQSCYPSHAAPNPTTNHRRNPTPSSQPDPCAPHPATEPTTRTPTRQLKNPTNPSSHLSPWYLQTQPAPTPLPHPHRGPPPTRQPDPHRPHSCEPPVPSPTQHDGCTRSSAPAPSASDGNDGWAQSNQQSSCKGSFDRKAQAAPRDVASITTGKHYVQRITNLFHTSLKRAGQRLSSA